MRILGVDYGLKRIGLALSDPLAVFAQPMETVEAENPDAAAAAIAQICTHRSVATIVIGLPRNMNDTLGPASAQVLVFAESLARATGLEVLTWDERLSTVQAERSLQQTGMSRRKRRRRVDAVAAQVILQSFLDARANSLRRHSTS